MRSACGATIVPEGVKLLVELEDKAKNVVAQGSGASGQLGIPEVKLWWPVGTVPTEEVGYLYKLKVTLLDASTGRPQDSYWLHVGIRTVTWSESEFFINGKPFYFKGCGRYEYGDVSEISQWPNVSMWLIHIESGNRFTQVEHRMNSFPRKTWRH